MPYIDTGLPKRLGLLTITAFRSTLARPKTVPFRTIIFQRVYKPKKKSNQANFLVLHGSKTVISTEATLRENRKAKRKRVLSIAGYQKKNLRLFGRLIPSALYVGTCWVSFSLGKRTSSRTLL